MFSLPCPPVFPPSASCDCHVHVVGPRNRFPLSPERRYTPKDAPVDALTAALTQLGLDRVVLVQPSFYGIDNTCMLAAMAQLPDARGVAVLPSDTPRTRLDEFERLGIRGLRINVATGGTASIDAVATAVRAAAALCEVHGWHVQLFIERDAIAPLASVLRDLPVDSVIDHFGLVEPGPASPPLKALTGLLETGKTWVKISGAYRICDDPDDPRIGPLAQTLCRANPDRIVWGSDWPHTPRHQLHNGGPDDELPYQAIDTQNLLNLLPRWLDDHALVERILVSNPATLYRF